MATEKEKTLQVKDFLGISRYYNSPNQPANKFYKCQNMYSPIKGELALIGGVTKLSGAGLPGSTSIKYVDFLKTAIGYERMLVFFDHAAIPTPSAPTAVTATGTAFTGKHYVKISYVGMGGESTLSAETEVNCTTGKNIVVTIPTFPTGVVSVNVFVGPESGDTPGTGTSHCLHATVSKRMGLAQQTSVTLSKKAKLSAVANTYGHRFAASGFSVSFGTSGTLESGKVYYFGIKPFLTSALALDVTTNSGQATLPTVTNPSGRIFSFVVPAGYNSVTISMTPRLEYRDINTPYQWALNSTDTQVDAWVFMGTTPNDMMAVCANVNGIVTPQDFDDNLFIAELPYNSNFCTYKQQQRMPFVASDYTDAFGFINCRANSGADLALLENNNSGIPTMSVSGLGIYAFTDDTYGAETVYQIMPSRGCGYYTKNNTTLGGIANASSVLIPESAGQFRIENQDIASAAYVNRLYFANGVQTPFFTNGYVLSQMPRRAQTPYLPITEKIALFNERLIAGVGENSLFNTQNVVYYSASGDPETWTATPGATAGLQFISALEADGDTLIGFGIYSESLSNVGISQFLIIGKSRSIYTWSGSTTTGAQLVTAETGFASGKAFCLSAKGPIVVGRENVYLLTPGGQPRKIGNDVEDILKNLSDTNIQTVDAVYHEGQVKIGYQESSGIDRELWLDLREDEGSVLPIFTGPHQMKSYTGQAATNAFAGVRNYRVSFLSNDLFKRDDFSSYLNDGSNIAVALETNDLALGADDFLKLVNSFRMKAKVRKSETLTLSTKMYDNKSIGQGLDYTTDNAEQTFSDSLVIPYAGSGVIYRTFEKLFTERYIGTLMRFSFTMSTNVDFRIQLMSWLYGIKRRRRV